MSTRLAKRVLGVALLVSASVAPLSAPAFAMPPPLPTTYLGRSPINARLTYTAEHCTYQYQFGNAYGVAYSGIRVSARAKGYACFASSSLMAAARMRKRSVFVSTSPSSTRTTDGDWALSIVRSANVFIATFWVAEKRQGDLADGPTISQFAVSAF